MISVLGIIPARGGSKRLPGKNLKQINGQSLLEITIKQAKKALPVSVISTDDAEIMREAGRFGVKTVVRPPELATDEASIWDVVRHVIWTFPGFSWFCLLQPTSPCRSVEDITNCVELAVESGTSVVSTYLGKTNGAVYVGKTLPIEGDFLHEALHYEMPIWRSVDINTQEDLDNAIMYSKFQNDTWTA